MSDPSERPAGHPGDLELELSRLGEADVAVEAHLASCAACTSRREELVHLAADLRGPMPMVPREREDAILAGLRQRMTQIDRRRRARRVGFVAAAAAAMLAGAFVVGTQLEHRAGDVPAVASHAAGAAPARDVNGDGRLDILDAFALARALQAGRATGPDMNGDGAVDRADVDALAAAAVSLDGRT